MSSDVENNVNGVPLLAKEEERPKDAWKGEFMKSIVYAGLDAIVTSFSLISSISAGRLSSVDVLVLGFANLVADGISMGFGDFVSSSTERDVAAKERQVTKWDVVHHRRHEQLELLQRYQEHGMSEIDATTNDGSHFSFLEHTGRDLRRAGMGASPKFLIYEFSNSFTHFSIFFLNFLAVGGFLFLPLC